MSKFKRSKDGNRDEYAGAKRRKAEREKSCSLNEELSIGSTVCPVKTRSVGTVGPFVRIKETGELCFLTVRHIFGPFQQPNKFLGRKVLLNSSVNKPEVCGEVIAAEYSESLDVALVKVSENCIPRKVKFIHVSDDDLRETGLRASHINLSYNVYEPNNVEDLLQTPPDRYRLIKISQSSGITVGKFYLEDGKVSRKDYTITIRGPNYTYTEVVMYKNQFCVVPDGSDEFANETDVGAAVYLVDKHSKLYCIGMICRLLNNNQGVLVTPVQDILTQLQQELGQTLEIETFSSDDQRYDCELFTRTLREGQEQDRHLRVNIIGFFAQGKTTLTRRLLGESLKDVESTDGIDVHIRKCKMKENSWEKFEREQELAELSHRLVFVARTVESSDKNKTGPFSEEDDELDLTQEIESNDQTEKREKDTGNVKLVGQEQHVVNKTIYTRQISKDIQTPESTVKCQQLFRSFSDELNENNTESYNELIATIWDFGGQYIYYATHQIFHSRDAIYLLVFDLRKGLNNILEDYDFPDRQEKMKTSLMFWVNSINAFVGTDDGTKPKIILVGTHKDMFIGDIEAKFKEVKDLFAGTEVRNHIYDRTFAVATLDMKDNVINELRETIYQIGEGIAASTKIPARWIPLEMALLEVRHRNIITFEEVKSMDAGSDNPIEDENQIKAFLKYHHEKGTLVFFDEEELEDHVILNPQFLIDAFRCIITSKTICDGSSKLHNLWKKMTNMAVLEKEIIDAVWSKEKNKAFFEMSSILLKFLKRHRILAELQFEDSSGNLIGMGKYMIPSFLKSTCSDATADSFLRQKSFSTTLLGIRLENNTVLATMYERITAAALGLWPPIKFEEQCLVFQNVGYYRLDRQHAGKITKREGQGIELMVIILCPSDEDIAVVSDRFRRYVEMVISQEFWKLHKDKREKLYSHYIKCNDPYHGGNGSKESHSLDNIRKDGKSNVCCPDYVTNHKIDVRKTIEEWFQEAKISEKHTGTVKHVTEKDLTKIAQAIGTNWELLGIGLGLSSDKIERIKQRNRDSGTATVIFYMLKEWKNMNQGGADQGFLIQTMKDTDVLSVNWDKIRNFLDDF